MESQGELLLRRLIGDKVMSLSQELGSISRAQLDAIQVGDQTHRVIDTTAGIWSPKSMAATLSIISDPESEYDDRHVNDSLFRYSYQRGTTEGRNRKLRSAIQNRSPIIMLRKTGAGTFVPIFPVYVVADDQESREFILALDEGLRFLPNPMNLDSDERRYAARVVNQRLHQPEFRARVLRAYETQCAVCSLKKGLLLDAAHIVGDGEDGGQPIITNGMALCKIHHAAFDTDLLGVSPDYIVHISQAVLDEEDGPMLKHGLQEMDKRPIALPKERHELPDRDRLASRFDRFKAAS